MQHHNGGSGWEHSEHRRTWRQPSVASGILTAVGSVGGAAAQRVVRITNISEGGVGIVATSPLTLGTEYDLQVAGMPDRSGRVRVVFCQQATDRVGFEIGTEYVK